MTLSQLVAESTARLVDLRHRHGPGVDAECFVSLPKKLASGAGDERDVVAVELFQSVIGGPNKWFFEIQTEKEPKE